jgi:hypothetical protein
VPWIAGLTICSILGGSYVGGYPEVFGIPSHLPPPAVLVGHRRITVFSLIVFYYAVHSRLGPARVAVNVNDAVADADQEELALEVEPA